MKSWRERIGRWLLRTKALDIVGAEQGDVAYMDLWNRHQAPSADGLVNSYEGTAYACANLCAQGVASVPLRLYVQTGPGQPAPKCARRKIGKAQREYLNRKPGIGRKLLEAQDIEEVTAHPIISLLDAVNSELDGFTLLELTQLYMEVVGSSYWLFEKQLGIVTAIWVLQSQFVTPVYRNGEAVAYEYGSGAKKETFPAEDVLPFHLPNLRNPYHEGWSPLRAAYESVHLQEQELAQAQSLMDNQARPDVVIVPKGEAGLLGDHEQERLQRRFRREFRRGRTSGVAVLSDQFEVKPLTFSPRELQSAVLHGITKENIANAFGVPMSLLQTKDVNRANAEAGHYQLAQNAILPRCRRLEQRLTQRFAALFDPRLVLAFDDPVPENRELRLTERTQAVSQGIISINEARADIGLDAITEGDVNLVPIGRRPLGEEPLEYPAPPRSGPEPEENALAIFDIMIRYVCGECNKSDAAYALIERGIAPHTVANWLAPRSIQPLPACCTDSNPGPYRKDWAGHTGKQPGHVRRLPTGVRLAKTLREVFAEQRREVLRDFKASMPAMTKGPGRIFLPGDAGSFFDANAWAIRMQGRVTPIWGIYARTGIGESLRRLTAMRDNAHALDPYALSVSEAIDAASLQFCQATNATTKLQLDRALDRLRQEIAEGILGADHTLAALTQRVNEVFTQASAYRAERIARTESSRAIHLGQRISAEESGVVRGFRLLLSADACPVCRDIFAQAPEIPLHGKFAVMGEGAYADIWSPPLHPNCMCTMTEILIDE